MTGQPSFTFRGTQEKPLCPKCENTMKQCATIQETLEEIDVYECASCKTEFLDRWTF